MTNSAPLIAEHDSSWRPQFTEERDRLREAVPEGLKDVYHVGATSVPGLAAAPVIDILMVRERQLSDYEIAALSGLGYEFEGEADLPGRQFFQKSAPRAFTLHVFDDEHMAGKAMVNFRNHLLAKPEERAELEAAKREMVASHGNEPDAYAREKDALLLKFDRKGALWAHEQWRLRQEAGGEEEEHD